MARLDPRIAAVTDRIIARSKPRRAAYLDLMDREAERFPNRNALSCSNLAHGFAAAGEDKARRENGVGLAVAVEQARAGIGGAGELAHHADQVGLAFKTDAGQRLAMSAWG